MGGGRCELGVVRELTWRLSRDRLELKRSGEYRPRNTLGARRTARCASVAKQVFDDRLDRSAGACDGGWAFVAAEIRGWRLLTLRRNGGRACGDDGESCPAWCPANLPAWMRISTDEAAFLPRSVVILRFKLGSFGVVGRWLPRQAGWHSAGTIREVGTVPADQHVSATACC